MTPDTKPYTFDLKQQQTKGAWSTRRDHKETEETTMSGVQEVPPEWGMPVCQNQQQN